MKIISIVGARPQFIKASVLCHAIAGAKFENLEHGIIHTGQHYDANMSDVFFQELDIPAPSHHLEVGSGSHGAQTGEMMKRIESVLEQERPQWVLLYGDTNSTVAGALVASKMGLRAAHVEAGLRSYNRRMPEELNRVVTDHLSDLLLCPTSLALKNLVKEGLGERAVITGDVMFDAAVNYTRAAETRYPALAEEWRPGGFALATVHRAENVDDPQRLREIIAALETIAGTICPVVLPLHPRTRKTLSAMGLTLSHVTVYRPVSYLEMLLLESRARFVITDSGGVQKEAYFARVPCITVRDETEWEETLENDCNVLTGADRTRILAAVERSTSAGPWDVVYGDGRAGSAVLQAMMEFDGASKALA